MSLHYYLHQSSFTCPTCNGLNQHIIGVEMELPEPQKIEHLLKGRGFHCQWCGKDVPSGLAMVNQVVSVSSEKFHSLRLPNKSRVRI